MVGRNRPARAAAFAAALSLAAAPFAAAPRASAALDVVPAGASFVSVFGEGLRAGGEPVSFVCATGVSLPEPPQIPEDAPEYGAEAAWETTLSETRDLAAKIAAAGFGMVRLSGLSHIGGEDAAPHSAEAVQDEFAAACRQNGLRIWAEALQPVLQIPVSAADSAVLDDPSTREAWENAVREAAAGGVDPFLAAPFDPRLEVVLQQRLRAWARAFNPKNGLRRSDDPTYALFGLSATWWDDLKAPGRPRLPEFFEKELETAWNNWLWEKRSEKSGGAGGANDDGNGGAGKGADVEEEIRPGFPLLPGESLEEGTVAFLDFGDKNLGRARRKEQLVFLFNLVQSHLERLAAPFSSSGPSTSAAPLVVRCGAERQLMSLSTASLLAPTRETAESPEKSAAWAAKNPGGGKPAIVETPWASDPASATSAKALAGLVSAAVVALPYVPSPPEIPLVP
ncbi:MAG: hypothetical protein IJ678_00430 [Kiritimatiellae bacterium]|nr:hypothetical protein [Kiritimatiellia bacterium]